MEVHSHGLETLGVNKDADKVYNPELKDILAPPSNQIPVVENFTVTPSPLPTDAHETVEGTNNISGSDSGAAPTATLKLSPSPSDLNVEPSDINFQQYESVVIEQNSQHEAHQVVEQEESPFDDMVILEDGMVTAASLSGEGAGDGLDTFQDEDIQMEDFQQGDFFNSKSVAPESPIEPSAGEKPEIATSVADAGDPVSVATDETVVPDVVVQELSTVTVVETIEITTVEVSAHIPSSLEKDLAANDLSGKQVVDGEQVPILDVGEVKVPETVDAADVVKPTGPDGETVPKSEAGSHEATEEDVKAMKGQKVVKKFGKKNYVGEVTHYDPETKWFKVVYEDGDDEDLELCELKLILASSSSSPSSSRKRSRTADGGDESLQKSSKKPKKTGTATKTKSVSKSSAKTPKTPGLGAKGFGGGNSSSASTKGKSPGKLIKKALEGPAFKTPVVSQIKEGTGKGKGKGKAGTSTSKSEKRGSSKKRTTGKVSRRLNLQSPKTQKKGKTKADAESSSSKKPAKSPKQQTSGLKRKAGVGETTAEKSTRSKRGVTEVEEASKGGVSSPVGKHVKKAFGSTTYDGVVVKHDKKTGFYKVKYEDGDQEDLEMHELEPILLQEVESVEEKESKPAKLSSLSSLMSNEKKAGTQKKK